VPSLDEGSSAHRTGPGTTAAFDADGKVSGADDDVLVGGSGLTVSQYGDDGVTLSDRSDTEIELGPSRAEVEFDRDNGGRELAGDENLLADDLGDGRGIAGVTGSSRGDDDAEGLTTVMLCDDNLGLDGFDNNRGKDAAKHSNPVSTGNLDARSSIALLKSKTARNNLRV
jgi:hypothetical protein